MIVQISITTKWQEQNYQLPKFFVSDHLKDVRGWQFLTIETAETLCMVC